MKEKTIVSGVTLLTSLLAYWYAKEAEKDPVASVMIGGFIGAVIGESVIEKLRSNSNNK